jgi:gamma-glutamyltranspeptidase/glutathione hydrolase
MTPTILVKAGRPAMVIGTPGGSRIFTWVFQVLANVYDHGLTLKAAQKAPRFHHQLLPENVIFYEPGYPPSAALKAALEGRGYKWVEDFSGDMEAIQIVGRTPVPEADPRARGVAMVVKP